MDEESLAMMLLRVAGEGDDVSEGCTRRDVAY